MVMLTHGSKESWLETVWQTLEPYQDDIADEVWDELCTAMAWIAEELNVVTEMDN